MSSASSPPTSEPPELAVVVVTYNSAETIRDCLAAVHQGGASAELVVVDNASADGSADLVAAEFPAARLIRNHINEGFGRGCNRGLRNTSAPYLLLLNPDAAPLPGALRALVDFATEHPRAAIIGPRILNADGSLQHSCFRFPNLRMVVTGFFDLLPLDSPLNGRYRPDEYQRPHQVEHLLGACLLIRREAIEPLGLLDEGFFMYFEETDLCYRTRAAGWENWYTPTAEVVHRGAHSTARDPERMSAAFYRSQARFYRKHYPPWRYLMLKLLSTLGVAYWTARTVRGLLRKRVDRATFRRRLASYWTIVWA